MPPSQLEAKGLLASLFDLDFQYFITLRFIKVIYVIALAGIGLVSLVLFVSLALRGIGGLAAAVVVVPVVALFYLILARVYLELIALLFRIAEHTSVLASVMGGPPSAGPGLPPYGAGPPQGFGPPQGYGPPQGFGPPPGSGAPAG